MNRKKKSLVTFVLAALIQLNAWGLVAQNKPFYLFNQLNEQQGLQNNVINDVIQDSIGYIWMATNDGIFRYNGSSFVGFRNIPGDTTSIPSNAVQTLHQDKKGRIWALTDYGIGIYSYINNQFKQILPGSVPSKLPYRSITSMVETKDGSGFLGTFGGGVLRFENGQFERLEGSIGWGSAEFDQQEVMSLLLDQDSVLWVGTWNDGLIFYDLKTEVLTPFHHSEFNPGRIHCIKKVTDQSYWVGTNEGLLIFDHAQSKPLIINHSTNPSFPGGEILEIEQDKNGVVWIGTRHAGLLAVSSRKLYTGNGMIENHFEPTGQSNSVNDRSISAIMQDQLGNIWIGTHNAGMNVFNPSGESIRSFSHIPNVPSLTHSSAWGICPENDSSIWVGTDGGGVNLLNPYTREISQSIGSQFSDQAILCALQTSWGELWFGTYEGGINCYNKKTQRTYIIGQKDGLFSLDIRALYESKDHQIWIGTNGSGLFHYNPDNKSLTHIHQTDYLDIRAIQEDRQGHLWLSSFGNGLLRFSPENKELVEYSWYADETKTPVSFCLLIDQDSIWVGSRQNGLLLFDPSNEEFISFSETEGLINNSVRAIVKDKKQNLWISTNTGISFFDRNTRTFRSFDFSDGLQMGQFNDGSGLSLPNGDLVFGGKKGLNVFTPEQLLQRRNAPKSIINQLIAFDKTQNSEPKEITIPLIDRKEKVVLKHQENSLTLFFEALAFPTLGSWGYEYRLKGLESEWGSWDDFGAATYRNLSPGSYIFQVRTTDVSKTSAGSISEIELEILPPWWLTWPAFLVYILLIGSLILIIYRYTSNQIKLKEKLNYEQKLRIQEQENIQQKIRFFTNFSHELRSPLTLIQGPVNDLLSQEDLEKHYPLLQMIRRNSTVLQKLVNRLLEFRKLETQKATLNIALNDLSVLIHEELESYRYQSGKSGLNIHFQSSHEAFAWVDIEKFHIIISNLLSNAVKYTPSGGTIKIETEKNNETIIIRFSDTGKGIDEKDLESIFNPFFQADNSAGKGGTGIGLALTKSFIELHGGKISVQSKPSGSTFTISLPNQLNWLKDQSYVRLIPQDEEAYIPAEKTSDEDSDQMDNQAIILIADDHPEIREYVVKTLEKPYKVIAVSNGEEAWTMAKKLLPDLIITDIMMPRMDGIELCKKLKSFENTNHIPIIVLTAKDADDPKVDAYEAGADGYITKPFSSRLLKTRIQNILNQRKALRDQFASGYWSDLIKKGDSPDIQFITNVESTVLQLLSDSEVTVPLLASELGYSRTSLYRKIKSLTGLSINHFIRLIKLKQSTVLLTHDDLTVSEVAFKLGFTDLKYFRNCFKEKYGMLPSEYQKKYTKDSQSVDESYWL